MEDNDNLYVLEEERELETEEDIDQSPLNFAAYGDEEDSEEEIPEEVSAGKKLSAFGAMLKIMFNPVEGWKDLRRSGIKLEGIQSGCLYPLLAILAVSKFADFFYSVNVTLSKVITEAVIAFVSFFFGFYCIEMVMSWFLSKEIMEKFEKDYGKEYLAIALSTLVLFSIVTDLLPMIWPILIFLPIWTLYIMFKGVRFFKLPVSQEMKFFVITGALSIAIPLVIDWGLNEILEII